MHSQQKLRVLIVDDNKTNLQILQVFLNRLGHEVIAAENGEEAVSRYRDQHPDLIFMDIMMPVMDGFEATREIRAIPAERWVPIIFLSALDRDENLVDGLSSGGDDYLTKPINFVVLEAKMRSVARTLALQQKVAESLRKLQIVSDNVLEAIITADSSATILSSNSATELMFGWSSGELIGKNVSILCPEPYRSEHDAYVSNYVNGGPPKIIGLCREIIARKKNGEVFDAELTVSEVRFDQKRLFIGVFRDITERKRSENLLKENADKLQEYYDVSEQENRFALGLIDQQLRREGLGNPLVSYWLVPAKTFSGDILGVTTSNSGRLYAVLADATGHGLTAAISTLPLLTLFYHLAPTDMPLLDLVLQLNKSLSETLPSGRFVGASLVCLDTENGHGELWIGGMPSSYLIDAQGVAIDRFESHDVPLGILDNHELAKDTITFSWSQQCELILCSDGLLEANGQTGRQFGEAGLLNSISGTLPGNRRHSIEAEITNHLGDQTALDDISLLVLSCLMKKA
ncbi:MAG: response regulator [Zoogloeaceae bacterium]|nr:response regulator [Zoogloeaceae bacterium]